MVCENYFLTHQRVTEHSTKAEESEPIAAARKADVVDIMEYMKTRRTSGR